LYPNLQNNSFHQKSLHETPGIVKAESRKKERERERAVLVRKDNTSGRGVGVSRPWIRERKKKNMQTLSRNVILFKTKF